MQSFALGFNFEHARELGLLSLRPSRHLRGPAIQFSEGEDGLRVLTGPPQQAYLDQLQPLQFMLL